MRIKEICGRNGKGEGSGEIKRSLRSWGSQLNKNLLLVILLCCICCIAVGLGTRCCFNNDPKSGQKVIQILQKTDVD